MIGQIIFGVLVGVSLKVLYDIDFYQHVAHVGTFHDCKYLDLDMPGPEDFQFYKNNIIIIGSGNFGDLFYKDITKVEVNGIFAIIDSHLDNFTVKRLNLIGFPDNTSLHIHGIDIVVKPDGDKLFVINHAFKYGGERIEVFEILPNLDLKYTHSIIVDQKYNGGLNDLVVISPTRFLVTNYQPETNSQNGRSQDTLLTKLSIVFSYLFKIKRTFLLDCQYSLGQNSLVTPECKIVPTSWTVVANGMTWDGKDRFWVADSLLQEVLEFKLVNNEVVHQKNLKIGFGLDNVVYHNEQLYLGMITRLYEFFDLERFNQQNYLKRDTKLEYWSTLGIYDLRRDRLRVVAQGNEFSKGTSTWLENGNNAFIGSWGDISVQVCKKN